MKVLNPSPSIKNERNALSPVDMDASFVYAFGFCAAVYSTVDRSEPFDALEVS
jgi:hypothetical protein